MLPNKLFNQKNSAKNALFFVDAREGDLYN